MKKFAVEFNLDSEKPFAEHLQFVYADNEKEAVEKTRSNQFYIGRQFFLFDTVEILKIMEGEKSE